MKLMTEDEEDQLKNTLICSAMHEFVMTRSPRAYAIHPLLGLLALRLQKPLLFVLFKELPHKANPEYSETGDWIHSFQRSDDFLKKFNENVSDYITTVTSSFKENPDLAYGGDGQKWFIPFPAHNNPALKGIGVFYIHFVTTEESVSDGGYRARYFFSLKETKIYPLIKEDFDALKCLFDTLVSHRTRLTAEIDEFTYWYHIESFLNACVKNGHAFFPKQGIVPESKKESNKDSENVTTVDPATYKRVLDPIFDGLDRIYESMRGSQLDIGNPGIDTLEESGAPIVLARHREATNEQYNQQTNNKRPGIRPPNIAFYIYLRKPNQDKDDQFRIVPVLTKTMCHDLSMVYWDHLQRGTITRDELVAFLTQLEVKNPERKIKSFNDLRDAIDNATSIKKFLDDHYHISFTYPAFCSGVPTFLTPEPASLCDRLFYGGDCLREEGGESAFITPITVSGFPFLSIITKTRAKLEWDENDDGERFDYETFDACWLFLQGVIRRSLYRIRRLIRTTYLNQFEQIIYIVYEEHARPIIPLDSSEPNPNYKYVYVLDTVKDALNLHTQQLAQILPFAKLVISEHHSDGQPGIPLFKEEDGLFIHKETNEYFLPRKISKHDDLIHLKDEDLEEAKNRAFDRLDKHWSNVAVRQPDNLPDLFK